jgi:hypothetical protein
MQSIILVRYIFVIRHNFHIHTPLISSADNVYHVYDENKSAYSRRIDNKCGYDVLEKTTQDILGKVYTSQSKQQILVRL